MASSVDAGNGSASPVAPAPPDAERLFATMMLIRKFEEAAYRCYEAGDIPGTVHVSIGQEAVAVGVIDALRADDQVLSHHRGHGHALAKGVDPGRLMAELFGKGNGVSGGKGGSMHATDVSNGFLGTLALVGSAVPLAVGVALASAHRGDDAVCVVFFGDGAVNQGVLYESFNLAAIWRLPVLFVCEDNRFAITTSAETATGGGGIVGRAASFGLEAADVDGQDVQAVRSSARKLVEAARSGRPALLHCLTYRFKGHSRGDPPHGLYRTVEEVARWEARDPLVVLASQAGLGERIEALETNARDRVEESVRYARSADHPVDSSLYDDVWG